MDDDFKPWKHRRLPPSSRKPLKEYSWAQRNPRVFTSVFTGVCLLIFFSRPLYDAFLRERFEGPNIRPPVKPT